MNEELAEEALYEWNGSEYVFADGLIRFDDNEEVL